MADGLRVPSLEPCGLVDDNPLENLLHTEMPLVRSVRCFQSYNALNPQLVCPPILQPFGSAPSGRSAFPEARLTVRVPVSVDNPSVVEPCLSWKGKGGIFAGKRWVFDCVQNLVLEFR